MRKWRGFRRSAANCGTESSCANNIHTRLLYQLSTCAAVHICIATATNYTRFFRVLPAVFCVYTLYIYTQRLENYRDMLAATKSYSCMIDRQTFTLFSNYRNALLPALKSSPLLIQYRLLRISVYIGWLGILQLVNDAATKELINIPIFCD